MRGLPVTTEARTMRQSWAQRIRGLPEDLANRYYRLSRRNKAVLFALIAINTAIIIAIIIVTPHRIGQWLNEFAIAVRGLGVWGMLLSMLMVVFTSHPPLFGFSASMTLIGFAFGIWPGTLIAFISSMGGAGLAFLSVRRFFPGMVRPNKQWDAFGRVMREKGTLLVCMIRWCPIPWAIGNGLFASIDSVSFPQFMLASIIYFPKLLIPVFIGSRLTSLSDPDASHDPAHFWLNMGSIGLSLCISTGTGLWIYRLTRKQMRRFEGDHEALDGLEEGLLAAAYADELARAREGEGEELQEGGRLSPGSGSGSSTGAGAGASGYRFSDDPSGNGTASGAERPGGPLRRSTSQSDHRESAPRVM